MQTIVIAKARNEEGSLLEWIAHKRAIGFDRVAIVTNDNTDGTLGLLKALKAKFDWFDYQEHHPGEKTAVESANATISAYLRNHAQGFYALNCDLDEFLFLPDNAPVQSLEKRFETAHSIAFNWMIYGSSGHIEKPAGLVLENYTWRCKEGFPPLKEFKSFFWVNKHFKEINAHWPSYGNGFEAKYEFSDSTPIPDDVRRKKPYRNFSEARTGGGHVKHYMVKSASEIKEKQARWAGITLAQVAIKNSRYSDEWFERFDRNNIHEPVDGSHLERVKSEMQKLQDAIAG